MDGQTLLIIMAIAATLYVVDGARRVVVHVGKQGNCMVRTGHKCKPKPPTTAAKPESK